MPQADAVAESFFGALKKERIKRRIYPNREAAVSNVFDYIEMRERGGIPIYAAPTALRDSSARQAICTFMHVCIYLFVMRTSWTTCENDF